MEDRTASGRGLAALRAATQRRPRAAAFEVAGADLLSTQPAGTVRGLDRLPVRRQPDGISCGPTCLRMILDHLEFDPSAEVRDIGRMCGTNRRTGTTDEAMARGLDALGLTWARPEARTTAFLKTAVIDGHIVILRTLMPGGFKHWVLLHGCDAEGFVVTCPALGRRYWRDDFVHGIWKARGYDFFLVSADRHDHPRAIEREQARRRSWWRPVHETTLADFLEHRRVIPDAKLTAVHHRMIQDGAAAIRALAGAVKREPIPYAVENFSFHAVPRGGRMFDMVVLDTANGRVAGGIAGGLRWVDPDYRGRNLGAEIVLAAFSDPDRQFLCPSSYSESGYRSRIAAHRIAVERALKAGLAVPRAVLEEYAGRMPGAAAALAALPPEDVGPDAPDAADATCVQLSLF